MRDASLLPWLAFHRGACAACAEMRERFVAAGMPRRARAPRARRPPTRIMALHRPFKDAALSASANRGCGLACCALS